MTSFVCSFKFKLVLCYFLYLACVYQTGLRLRIRIQLFFSMRISCFLNADAAFKKLAKFTLRRVCCSWKKDCSKETNFKNKFVTKCFPSGSGSWSPHWTLIRIQEGKWKRFNADPDPQPCYQIRLWECFSQVEKIYDVSDWSNYRMTRSCTFCVLFHTWKLFYYCNNVPVITN